MITTRDDNIHIQSIPFDLFIDYEGAWLTNSSGPKLTNVRL